MKDWSIGMNKSRWKLKDQALFLTKLGELLENGYSLSDAIRFLKFQESKKKQADLQDVLQDFKNGYPLHYVNENEVSQLVSYIYYGEQYGELSLALKEGGQYWTKRTEDVDKIKKILVYPIFLIFFVGNVFMILQSVLLPKFESLFTTMSVEQNVFLTFILATSDFSPKDPRDSSFHSLPCSYLQTILVFQVMSFKTTNVDFKNSNRRYVYTLI